MNNQVLDTEIEKPQEKGLEEIQKESGLYIQQAKELVVTNPEEYSFAENFGSRAQGLIKRIKFLLDPFVSDAKKGWDSACARRKAFLDIPEEAKAIINTKLLAYRAEQQKKAEIEQAKINEKIRKEQEALLAKAKAAAEKGKGEKAEELMRQAQTVVAPVVSAAIPKSESSSFVTKHKGILENAELVPDMWWIIDDKAVQKFILDNKGTKPVPGYKIVSYEEARMRGK